MFSVTQSMRCWQFLTLITPLEQMIMTSSSFALLLFNKPRAELANNSQTNQKQIQKSIWEKVSVHVYTGRWDFSEGHWMVAIRCKCWILAGNPDFALIIISAILTHSWNITKEKNNNEILQVGHRKSGCGNCSISPVFWNCIVVQIMLHWPTVHVVFWLIF